MRTTVTLDPDVEQLVRKRMSQRHISFKQALNDSIRDGNNADRATAPATTPASMGTPAVNLDRALQLTAALEDDELIRRMRAGK